MRIDISLPVGLDVIQYGRHLGQSCTLGREDGRGRWPWFGLVDQIGGDELVLASVDISRWLRYWIG